MKWFFNKFLGVWKFLFFWFFFFLFQYLLFLLFFMLSLFLFFVFFCHFWKSYLSLFFPAGFFSPSFGFLNTVFGVLNFNYSFLFLFCVLWEKGLCVLSNCLNKDPHHMRMASLLKWWTMNKINTNAHIGKSHYFQVVHSILHSNMGCEVSSPCNDQIKEGWETCQFNLS